MISEKEVIKKHKKLLLDVKTKDFYKMDLTNRVNCYLCHVCKHITKTKDVDAGVTPMFSNCELCKSQASSTGYKDIAPDKLPTFEWFRPPLSEIIKLIKKPHIIDHILKGGLMLRPVPKPVEPKEKDFIEGDFSM